MKVLICGSRHFTNQLLMYEKMADWSQDVTVIHGGARGADSLAGELAAYIGLTVEVFPANWAKYGRKAGPIRNQQMLDEGKPDLVMAFPLPSSVGTLDMINRAQEAGIPVEIVEDKAKAPDLKSEA